MTSLILLFLFLFFFLSSSTKYYNNIVTSSFINNDNPNDNKVSIISSNIPSTKRNFILSKFKSNVQRVPTPSTLYNMMKNQLFKLTNTFQSSKTTIPPFLLFLLMTSRVESAQASPLNPQAISISGPFFQGWLVRAIDHIKKRSFIFIVGSFSPSSSDKFSEHYIFCGLGLPKKEGGHSQFEIFPSPEIVTIKNNNEINNINTNNKDNVNKKLDEDVKRNLVEDVINPEFFSSSSPLNITWNANGIGQFTFTEYSCQGDFKFPGLHLKFNAKNRMPWEKMNPYSTAGPEGWLGFTTLLPCHYFIHSVGSTCSYDLITNKRTLTGNGYAHVEGNHGTAFPEGWIWAQSIASNNEASISVVAGKFSIGMISPMTFIIYLRFGNDQNWIFRSTDLDKFSYNINPFNATVHIEAICFSGKRKLVLDIKSLDGNLKQAFGEPVYIPTIKGFSNRPGCKETYTAEITATCYEYCKDSNDYVISGKSLVFQQSALEFGGIFQHLSSITSKKY